MGMESQTPTPEIPFEKRDADDLVLYVFKDVAVAIDTTERPMKKLPEILFGNFKGDFSEKSLHQPSSKIEGVNMDYVAKCVKEVAKDTGIKEFLLFPYGDDEPEHRKRRAAARLKLFSKYFHIDPDPQGGYVVRI